MKAVHLITAICENNGIGINNMLPWKLRKELNYFRRKTTETKTKGHINAVVMGRKTWEALPFKYKPFPNRLNVVVSTTESNFMDGVQCYTSVEDAVNTLQNSFPEVESIWIIGGRGIYKEALDKKLCNKLYITRIQKKFKCDIYFPEFNLADYILIEEDDVPTAMQEENGIKYKFEIYQRK